MSKRPTPHGIVLGMALCLLLPGLAGCGGNCLRTLRPPAPPVVPESAPAPEKPWIGPEQETAPKDESSNYSSWLRDKVGVVPKPKTSPKDPEEFSVAAGRTTPWTLVELVNHALMTNPQTRVAWATALAARGSAQSRLSSYYPTVDAVASASRGKGSLTQGNGSSGTNSFGPSVQLSYLVWDSGGRSASADEAKEAFLSAAYTHNAVLQSVALGVEQAFWSLEGAKALVSAQEATIRSAEVSLAAAEERHKAGLATAADVWQAKAFLAQTRLNLETVRGQVASARGVLANAAGLPLLPSPEVSDLPETVPLDKAAPAVEALMAEARKRPDLASLEAQVRRSEARVRMTESDGRPYLSASAGYGHIFNSMNDTVSQNYAFGLTLRIPLFNGYSSAWNRASARSDMEAARGRLSVAQQQAVLSVWTAFQDLRTAGDRVRACVELISAAESSYEVALGRYQSGVGTVVDMVTALATLEQARGQSVRARADWFLAASRLAWATGKAGAGLDSSTNVSTSLSNSDTGSDRNDR